MNYILNLDKKVSASFKSCGYILRANSSTGLWLLPLVPTSLIISVWRYLSVHNGSVPISNLYFSTTVVSVGLLISTIIYVMRFLPKAGVWVRNFSVIFVFPAAGTLLTLLYSQNGFVWSLVGGLLSSYGILAGLPSLLTVAPGCFTLGEAVIIVHAIVLFLFSSFVNLFHLALSQISPMGNDSLSYDTATAVLQIGLFGILTMVSILIVVPAMHQPKPFYIMFGILILGILTISHVLLNGSPLLWILSLFTRDYTSITLFVYWIICCVICVIFIWKQSLAAKKASTSQRKVFHILAVAVFSGGLIYAPDILYLASGVIFAVFAALEAVRLLDIPPFSEMLQSGFVVFVDEKDACAALTPLYLLAGVSAPLWVSPINMQIPKYQLLPLFSGILSIGIGDSAASFFGSRYGRTKWPGSNRTVEGSVACFISQLLAIMVLVYYGFVPEDVISLKTISSLTAVTLIEANTDQVDNLVLPLVLYILLV